MEIKLTQWTPGPWSTHDNGTISDPPSIRREGTGTFVAFMTRDLDEGVTDDEAYANARLVAAAPRLHAALAAIVGKLDALGTLHTPTLDEARAALAQAEGRS